MTSTANVVQEALRLWRRFGRLMTAITLGVLALGLVFQFTTPKSYTSTASIYVDQRQQTSFGPQQQMPVPIAPPDTAEVDSQVEVLRSERIAEKVIQKLNLDDPDKASLVFNQLPVVEFFLDLPYTLGILSGSTPYETHRLLVTAFGKALKVERQATTYVVEVRFTTASPQLSAEIANAIVDTYLVDLLDSKYESARVATNWMQNRIEELRQNMLKADEAVQAYKGANGIVESQGQLLNEQQLSQLNTALINARADLASARAKSDQMEEIRRRGDINAMTSEAWDSPVAQKLRLDYADLVRRYSDLTRRLNTQNDVTLDLKQQMLGVQKQLVDEFNRLTDVAKSAYSVQAARVKALESGIGQLSSESQLTNEKRVKLNELVRQATANHSLYDNFLNQMRLAMEQQSYPIAEARSVTKAVATTKPSFPRAIYTLPAALALGLLLSIGIAYGRDHLDEAIRTVAEAQSATGARVIGLIPEFPKVSRAAQKAHLAARRPDIQAGRSPISRDLGNLRFVVDQPFSRMAETMRAMRLAAQPRASGGCGVFGIVSAVPREGKSSIAANYAFLLASSGSRVCLIDGDLRKAMLSQDFGLAEQPGLVEVLSGGLPLEQAQQTETTTGLVVIPSGHSKEHVHGDLLLGSAQMTTIVEGLKQQGFDAIIIDLPPILSVVDAQAVAHLVDGFFYVIRWGWSARDTVAEAVRSSGPIADKIIGSVINKVPMNASRRFDTGYHDSYGSYDFVVPRQQLAAKSNQIA